MSGEASAIPLHHSKATGTTKLVLLGIANHDGDGGAWPTVATLAKYANADRRTIQRAIEKLEAMGDIRRILNGGGNHSTADHHRPNLYEFRLTCPTSCDRSKNHRTTRVAPVSFDLEELSTGAAPTPPLVVHTGGTHAAGGATPTPPKPSLNHQRDLSEPSRVNARDGEPVNNGDICPNSTTGHDYRADPTRCGVCGIRADQWYDPISKEIRSKLAVEGQV